MSVRELSKEEIEQLVTHGVRESRTIEFKAELPAGTRNGRREFLADVTSFANSLGGEIFFGVLSSDGAAVGTDGLQNVDVDSAVLRLESLIRDGVDPRISGVSTYAVEGFSEGPVLVLRVPNSWAAPHMVTLEGWSKFFVRSSTGKYPMDVHEIRSAFLASEGLPERIRQFRDVRLSRIRSGGGTPVPLGAGPKVVLHVLPYSAFSSATSLSPPSLAERRDDFQPIEGRGHASRFNLDGFITYTAPDDERIEATEYCQVFRSGVVEAVDLHLLGNGQKLIPPQGFEQGLSNATSRYMDALRDLGVAGPCVISVCLFGVRGFQMAVPDLRRSFDPTPIEPNDVQLPDVLIEPDEDEVWQSMRPVFDALWNAAGYPSSPSYE